MNVNNLYARLWVLVVVLLSYNLYYVVEDIIPKEQVVDYHVMMVTAPMLDFVDNKDQLASIIGHELGHIILGHTIHNDHKPENEYHVDMIGMFLARKAGYSNCGMDKLWTRMADNYMSLHTGSHPNALIRAYYLKMPQCEGVPIYKEKVTHADAVEIFHNMVKGVEGNIRYNTLFNIDYRFDGLNAYVYTVTKEKK